MIENNYIITVHDELISNLILLNCNNIIYNDAGDPTEIATISGKRANISIISTEDKLREKHKEECFRHWTSKLVSESDNHFLKNSYCLTAQEIIVYLILMHHYIINNQNHAIITIKQINKEYRQKKSINDRTYDAYVRAIKGLNNKEVYYKINKKYVGNHKLVNFQDRHKLLVIEDIVKLNNDISIVYNLGTLGEIIKDSKNYSAIVPKNVYSISFSDINYFLVMQYLSRMVFINRRRKHPEIFKKISLCTIFKNINKYNKQGYNQNVNYDELMYKTQIDNEKLKVYLALDEDVEDDYNLTNSKKAEYYNKLNNSTRRKIDKNINKNRDLKMLLKNIQKCLTVLKYSYQIYDFAFLNNKSNECKIDEIHLNNYSEFLILLAFYKYDFEVNI